MASIGGLNLNAPINNSTSKPSGSSMQHTIGQLFGHALNALPGYSTLGAQITNPNVNYLGKANPGPVNSSTPAHTAPQQQAPISPNIPNGDYSQFAPDGGTLGGAGGSAASGPQPNYGLASALDNQINTYRGFLGDLGNQQHTQESILNGQFGASRASLDTSHNRAVEDLNTQRGQVTQNRARSLNDLAVRGRNLIQAFNNQLGSVGAGSSSASQVLAPFAIAQQQNHLGGDVNRQAEQQNQAIDTESNRTEQDYKTHLDSLEQDRLSKLLDVGSRFSDLAHQYELAIQTADAQKAQALNGEYNAAINDVNDQVAQIEGGYKNALSNIQNYYSSYNPQAPSVAAPTNSVQNINTQGFTGIGLDPNAQQAQVAAAFLGDNKDQKQPILY